jgi:hypothetical protein
VGNCPPVPRGSLKHEFLEHLLKCSTKKVDLSLCSTFFLELELLELNVFGRKLFGVGGLELF